MSVVLEIRKKLSDDIDLSSALYNECFKNLKQYQLWRSINRDDLNSCVAYAQGWFLKPRFFKKKYAFNNPIKTKFIKSVIIWFNSNPAVIVKYVSLFSIFMHNIY